jgi:4-phosphopantoate--beta-alanine ligase
LGKQVLVVDLNPLSRTAKMATVTIVDEISRAAELLLEYTIKNDQMPTKWNNNGILNEALEIIATNSRTI